MAGKSVITHNGRFHADDVYAVAAFELLFGEAQVIRTRDAARIASAECVIDVGGIYDPSQNRFDHHQQGGAGKRENGIPYAALGLFWKEYGVKLCGSSQVAERIDWKFIQPLDAEDNGIEIATPLFKNVYPFTASDIVASFFPTWKESDTSLDEAFRHAVSLAKTVLERMIAREKARNEGAKFVEEEYRAASDKRLIVLSAAYPWKEVLSRHPEPLFVIFPREDDGTWGVSAVRDNPAEFKNRLDFPVEWAGKRDAEFQAISGVDDAIFCHNNRFMVVARSKEGAMRLAQLAIKNV